jgi:hypothetical protein
MTKMMYRPGFKPESIFLLQGHFIVVASQIEITLFSLANQEGIWSVTMEMSLRESKRLQLLKEVSFLFPSLSDRSYSAVILSLNTMYTLQYNVHITCSLPSSFSA